MKARGAAMTAMIAAAAMALAACGEKAQTAGPANAKKADAPAWQGTQGTHQADGFKASDKAAWEAQLKTRAERGQNEYSRTTAAKPK